MKQSTEDYWLLVVAGALFIVSCAAVAILIHRFVG